LKKSGAKDIRLRFTAAEKVKTHGFAGKIWEEVSAPEDDDQDEEEDDED
jgi:hypothetical protein